ncbi:hypothetical protein [Fuscibacter oryzae]|uniref:Uncharacterized protein n=1 Tax=Fuscibacter oryzae TaxID=2803939 RepID=A0A8J7MRK4_9RHOB|nr:hypothetical protein [Fuscibacter oryzae]MBL4927524.1 hypothetical protein [Fuscibacter oryzae]
MTIPSRPLPDAATVRPGQVWIWLACGGLGLAWLGALQVLWRCLAEGGQKWLQADWLINLAAGPVRRGPFGEALIRLAELSGLTPLAVVGLVQAVLVSALFLATLRLVAVQTRPAMVLAVLSPGFFAVLWSADALAGLRKEMIPLLALVLLALPRAGLGRLVVSAGLLAAGAWGHEVGVLMLPAWGIALLLFPPDCSRRAQGAVAAVTAAVVLWAAIYALRHAGVADTAPICDRILQLGPVHPAFCDGAIAWLGTSENGPGTLRRALDASHNLLLLPVAIGLAVAPLAHLCRLAKPDRHLLALILLAAAPPLLLYPLAIDWGRWVSLQVSTLAILLLGLGARGRFRPEPCPRPALMVLWLFLAVAAGLQAMTEVHPGALLFRLLHGFAV